MIGILVVTHSPLASALIESSKMIAGDEIKQCEALVLTLGEDLDDFSLRFQKAIEDVDSGEGVLVLVDLFAGTPANVAMRAMRNRRFECITGVNLGMLLEVLTSRTFMTMEELKKAAIEAGKSTIVDIGEKLFGGNV